MDKSRGRFLALAFLFTLIAVGIHLYLAEHHYLLRYGGGEASICNINAKLNCDAVSASAYAQLFGIPMAVWGAVTNIVLAFLLLVSWLRWTENPEFTGRLSLVLSLIVFVASVVMGGISATLMSTYCVFCMTAYLLSLFTLVCTWKGVGGFAGHVADDFHSLFTSQRWALGCFIAIPALAYLGHVATQKNMGVRDADRFATEYVNTWLGPTPQRSFSTERGLKLKPELKDAAMTLSEFADFLCPHCRHAAPSLDAFAQAHPDVQLVFKFFPLASSCDAAKSQDNGVRCQMALITHCEDQTRHQGWAAHHYFFDHQEELFNSQSPDEVTKRYCADSSGVDCAALKTCTDASASRDAVLATIREGDDAEIQGTPTIFANGRLLKGGQLMPVLEKAYQAIKEGRFRESPVAPKTSAPATPPAKVKPTSPGK